MSPDRLTRRPSVKILRGQFQPTSTNRPRGVHPSTTPRESLLNYGLGRRGRPHWRHRPRGHPGIGDQGIGASRSPSARHRSTRRQPVIHPRRIILVVPDVGTGELRACSTTSSTSGCKTRDMRGERYDDFRRRFVSMASRLFPKAMIHWEDFAGNAHRLLTSLPRRLLHVHRQIQGQLRAVARGHPRGRQTSRASISTTTGSSFRAGSRHGISETPHQGHDAAHRPRGDRGGSLPRF